jgi:hypothetical protein
VIAAMIDAWAVNVVTTAFWSNPFNVPFMVGFGAIALLFTGARMWSLDQRFQSVREVVDKSPTSQRLSRTLRLLASSADDAGEERARGGAGQSGLAQPTMRATNLPKRGRGPDRSGHPAIPTLDRRHSNPDKTYPAVILPPISES